MAIGFLSFQRLVKPVCFIALVGAFLTVRSFADDQITKKGGEIISGQILSVSDGQVTIQSHTSTGGMVTLPVYLTDIQSVTMTPPADFTKVNGTSAAPATVISTLEPLVKQFAGLPADWVPDAMAQLGDAYDASGQGDRASAIYNQINQLYPGSAYQMLAQTGKAKQCLKAGKVDDALAAVQPLITEANQNLAPSPSKGRLYANAFLVYGQALEAQKKFPQALEAYLTVKTIFCQNPALVDQAEALAKNLYTQNPGLGVD